MSKLNVVDRLKISLGFTVVKWVDNTQREYPHLEAGTFFLVITRTEQLAFTRAELARPSTRFAKNPEDTA